MEKKYLILSLCIGVLLAFTLPAYAQQQRKVTGTVVFEDGEPVIGATIKQNGTTNGTLSDVDGKFAISVPDNAKLTVSFMGCVSQTISDLSKTHHIVLTEDALKLDDVVVVGYGVQKKAHLTGAITTVAMDDIADLSGPSLSMLLKGYVSGLSVSGGDSRPGSTARLSIRQNDVVSGQASASGYVPETSPLYVIDGFVYPQGEGERAFNNLDPTMVENISILKDGAAAVYGARSGNGVVLVTTKRGKDGAPKISYSGQFGFTDEVSRAKMLDAYNYGKVWNGMRGANASETWNNRTELFQKDELDAMRGLNYDLLDNEWSAALTQKHSVNMGGGSEYANYFAGISYNTQDGNIGKIDYDRWNYRAGVDLKVNKWMKASLQVSGDYSNQSKAYSKVGGENAETDYNILLTHPRYIPEYVDGHPMATYGITNGNINDTQLYHYSVIQDLGNYSKSVTQNMMINGSMEYDFGWSEWLKGLKLKFTYSKTISTNKGNQYATNYKLYKMEQRGGSGEHLYTGDNLNLDETNFSSITVNNGNMLRRTSSRTDNYQMNFIALYERKFGDHSLSGMFAVEKSEGESETLDGAVLDPYPFTNGQSNSATGTQTTEFGRSESGSLSYIGRVNYAYADKYLLEFLIRSDASVKFAPENYWGAFPSVSAGWVISQEEWFREKFKGIDFFKLRGSFGLSGRDNIPAWAWLRVYGLAKDKGPIFGNSSAGTSTGTHISVPDVTVNRLARWDKSYKSNFGIDLNTLKNRFSANLDGYYEMNRDIFMSRTGSDVPSTVGASAANENYGSIDVYGLELSLGWKDKIGKDFKYGVRVNTGYSDNKVLKRPWPTLIAINELHPDHRSDVGTWGLESLGMFRSYQEIEEYFDKYKITNYLGMSKDNVRPGMLIYKDIRGSQNADGTYAGPDGKVDLKEDLVQISNRDNPYGLTVNFNAEWKGISFSAQVNGSWGGYSYVPEKARSISSLVSSASGSDVMQFTNLPSFWANNMFVYEDVLDANGNVVAEANRDAKYPNLAYNINNYQSTFWKISGTRVTLRNVTMGYTLPRSFVKKMSIESCRLNLSAQNLLSLYNPYPDNFIDPLSGNYGSYPNLRRITLGLNVSF